VKEGIKGTAAISGIKVNKSFFKIAEKNISRKYIALGTPGKGGKRLKSASRQQKEGGGAQQHKSRFGEKRARKGISPPSRSLRTPINVYRSVRAQV